jgi:hypothetical protein
MEQITLVIHEIDLFFMTEAVTPDVFAFLLEGFRYNRAGQETIVEIAL